MSSYDRKRLTRNHLRLKTVGRTFGRAAHDIPVPVASVPPQLWRLMAHSHAAPQTQPTPTAIPMPLDSLEIREAVSGDAAAVAALLTELGYPAPVAVMEARLQAFTAGGRWASDSSPRQRRYFRRGDARWWK